MALQSVHKHCSEASKAIICAAIQANGTDVVDLTEEEELACTGTAVRIGVNPKGTVGYVETAGSQSVPPEKLLVPSSLVLDSWFPFFGLM